MSRERLPRLAPPDLDEAQRDLYEVFVGGPRQSRASFFPVAVAVADLVASCVAEFGLLDGLVNNAGVLHETKPWDLAAEQTRAMVEVYGAIDTALVDAIVDVYPPRSK